MLIFLRLRVAQKALQLPLFFLFYSAVFDRTDKSCFYIALQLLL